MRFEQRCDSPLSTPGAESVDSLSPQEAAGRRSLDAPAGSPEIVQPDLAPPEAYAVVPEVLNREVVAVATTQLISEPRKRAMDETHQALSVVEQNSSPPRHLMLSTLLSLMVVLILMIAVRLVVPPLVESIRYAWFRGQLRAEYELSGERLNTVSLKSLTEVSKLISRRVGPSVVHINLLTDESDVPNLRAARSLGSSVLLGQGSGFVIDTDGHILTNQHVVDGVDSIEVTLSDGRRLPARVFQKDLLTDIAILKIDADGLMPVTWGDSDSVDVGTPVWAVGSPFGLEQSVTFGILSGKHRLDLKGIQHAMSENVSPAYGDLMQSDVAVNPGNSGGPLVNAAGEIVGVNTAIVGDSYRGISFSIPSNVAKNVAQKLISDGEVVRGWLGVSLQEIGAGTASNTVGKELRGALVSHFALPSPASDAGMKPGDVIVSFNGKNVEGVTDLQALIAKTKVDSFVKVVVVRDGNRITLDVKIARRRNEMARR